MEIEALQLQTQLPVRAVNAGFFNSRGLGQHPERIIDSYEVILVNTGTLGLFEADNRYEIQAGQAIILHPHLRHGGTKPYSAELSFYWIHFYLDHAANHPEAQALILPKWTQLPKPEQPIGLLRLFLEHQELGVRSQLSFDLLLMNILCEIADSHSIMEHAIQANALASRADGFIRTRFHEPLTTSAIAEAIGCNPDYLGRIYHRVFHKTLTAAIYEYRLKQATHLLLEGTWNINEVARKSGFADTGYFRKVFKRAKGITPSSYRRNYSLVHVNTD